MPRPPDLPIEIPIYWDEDIDASIAIYCWIYCYFCYCLICFFITASSFFFTASDFSFR